MFVFEQINITKEFSVMDMVVANMLQFRSSDNPMIIIEMQIGGWGWWVVGKGRLLPVTFYKSILEEGKGERDKKCAVFPQNFFLFVFVSTHNLGEAEELKS